MARVNVKIEGREELKRKFDQLQQAARGPALQRAAMAGAKVIQTQANQRAPGPHILAEVSKTEGSDLLAVVEIGPDEEHWFYRYMETGAGRHKIGPTSGRAVKFSGVEGEEVRFSVEHPGITARPFLRPAMDAGKGAAVQATGAELRRAISQVEAG